MTPAREVSEGILAARASARGVLERFGVRTPEDIDVSLFAAAYGAFVSWPDTVADDVYATFAELSRFVEGHSHSDEHEAPPEPEPEPLKAMITQVNDLAARATARRSGR